MRNILSKNWIVATTAAVLLALAALPSLTLADAASVIVNTDPANIAPGATVSVKGTCPTNIVAASVVDLSLTQNSTNVVLARNVVTSDSLGNFNTSVAIPSNVAAGPAMLTVTCDDGTSSNTNFNIVSSASTKISNGLVYPTIVLNAYNIAQSDTVQISGACGPNAIGQVVSFRLANNATRQTVSTSGIAVSPNGTFSAALVIPTDFVLGQATLTAICGSTGLTTSAPVNIVAGPILPGSSSGGSSGVTTPAPTIITTPDESEPSARVAAASTGQPIVLTTTTTPTGGVAAGEGGAAQNRAALPLLAVIIGLTGGVAYITLKKFFFRN